MITIRDRTAFIIGAVAGGAGWLAIALSTGRREAWDTGAYFSLLLPALALLVAGLGYAAPQGAWRWGFAPFAGQALVAFIQNPTANLMPLGLIVFAVYGAVLILPAIAGATVRRRLDPEAGATT